MFQVVLSLASRFLYVGNMLQGFAHRILALRSLDAISSRLIPALPPPLLVPLLDAPAPFVELLEEFIFPFPSVSIERHMAGAGEEWRTTYTGSPTRAYAPVVDLGVSSLGCAPRYIPIPKAAAALSQ